MSLGGPFGIKANVVKKIFAQTVEGDALHETSRNDAIGIDIVTWNMHGRSTYLFYLFQSHVFYLLVFEYFPSIADHAGDRSRRNHNGTHEHGSARRAALPALEVAVTGTGAKLIADKFIRIHG